MIAFHLELLGPGQLLRQLQRPCNPACTLCIADMLVPPQACCQLALGQIHGTPQFRRQLEPAVDGIALT